MRVWGRWKNQPLFYIALKWDTVFRSSLWGEHLVQESFEIQMEGSAINQEERLCLSSGSLSTLQLLGQCSFNNEATA